MNIDLTRKEFLDLKKWINLEIKCAEGYIEKEINNPKNKVSVEYLQNKLKMLKPICDKINNESENIKIRVADGIEKEIISIKIIKCSSSNFWYKDLIGSEFQRVVESIKDSEKYRILDDGQYWNDYIYKSDCEVI